MLEDCLAQCPHMVGSGRKEKIEEEKSPRNIIVKLRGDTT